MIENSLSNALADLAERIRLASASFDAATLTAAEKAMEAGGLLVEAKAACRHGDWLPLLARAGMAERAARRLMGLAQSGLKSAIVADLGTRAACDLAERRRLPRAGECLQIAVGQAPVNAIELAQGELTAWVWESDEHPDYFHVASWADRLAVGSDEVMSTGTKRPIRGSDIGVKIIFTTVDEVLDRRYAEMRFTTLREGSRGPCRRSSSPRPSC